MGESEGGEEGEREVGERERERERLSGSERDRETGVWTETIGTQRGRATREGESEKERE